MSLQALTHWVAFTAEERRYTAVAEVLAQHGHWGQFRRDGVTPYMTHVNAVVLRLKDPLHIALGFVHDTKEPDCVNLLTDGELRAALIPERVIAAREVFTRRVGQSYPDHIAEIKAFDGGFWVPVKVADNLANLSDSPTKTQIVRYANSLLTLLS